MIGLETFQLLALFAGGRSLGKSYIIINKSQKILFVIKTKEFNRSYSVNIAKLI